MLGSMKSGELDRDEAATTAFLTLQERAFFTEFTPEEWAEWNEHWRQTPVDFRISAAMITPQWDIGSMYLAFEPHAYPYGGTGCMVAFIECFGHTVIGIEDGTGYREYEERPIWRPKNARAEA